MKKSIFSIWTDAQFKKIFFGFMLVVIVPSILLLLQTRPMEDKYRALMESKQVYVVNPDGNLFLLSALKSQEQTFQIFGKQLVKKMLDFDYTGSPENLNYVSHYTTETILTKILNATKALRSEAETLTGSYRAEISQTSLKKDRNSYYMDVWFAHKLISKPTTSSKDYIIALTLVSGSPTPQNYSGIFLEDFDIISSDSAEYAQKKLDFTTQK